MWGYNDAVKDYPYDPAGAKKLLAEAGCRTASTPSSGRCRSQRPYNPNARRMAEMIQADWQKVGVNAKIVTYEWGEYLKRTQGRRAPDACSWAGPATMATPTTSCDVLLGCDAAKDGTNRARWCYKPFDDLIKQAKQITRPGRSAPSSTSRRR